MRNRTMTKHSFVCSLLKKPCPIKMKKIRWKSPTQMWSTLSENLLPLYHLHIIVNYLLIQRGYSFDYQFTPQDSGSLDINAYCVSSKII